MYEEFSKLLWTSVRKLTCISNFVLLDICVERYRSYFRHCGINACWLPLITARCFSVTIETYFDSMRIIFCSWGVSKFTKSYCSREPNIGLPLWESYLLYFGMPCLWHMLAILSPEYACLHVCWFGACTVHHLVQWMGVIVISCLNSSRCVPVKSKGGNLMSKDN